MTAPDISIIVPVHRNADTLEELHGRLACALAGMPHEVVFVDDASPDGSLDVLRAITAADPLVAVLSLERNVGQHRALLAGLGVARGHKVVFMDADLQDPPEAVPVLLGVLAEGDADAVFGGRCGRYESTGRLVTSRVFKTALALVSGVPKDAGLFVAVSRPLAERLLSLPFENPFLVGAIGASGLPMRSIPVERAVRPRGVSAYSRRARLVVATRALAQAAVVRFVPPRVWARRPRMRRAVVKERLGWAAEGCP